MKSCSLQGLLVLEKRLKSGVTNIDAGRLTAGTYLVQLKGGGFVETKKLVKY
jgi:hypothetical protein